MDDFQPGGVVGLAGEFSLQPGFIARQDEIEVRIGGQGGQGARHGRFGAVVAAEAVDENLDHDSFFT